MTPKRRKPTPDSTLPLFGEAAFVPDRNSTSGTQATNLSEKRTALSAAKVNGAAKVLLPADPLPRRTPAAKKPNSQPFLAQSLTPTLREIFPAAAKFVDLHIHGVHQSLFSIEWDDSIITIESPSPLGGHEHVVIGNVPVDDLFRLPGAALTIESGFLVLCGTHNRRFRISGRNAPFDYTPPDTVDVAKVPHLTHLVPYLTHMEHCVIRSNGIFSAADLTYAAMSIPDDVNPSMSGPMVFVKAATLGAVLRIGSFTEFALHKNQLFLFGDRWQAKLPGCGEDVRALDPWPLIDVCKSYPSVAVTEKIPKIPELPIVQYMTVEITGRSMRILSPGFNHSIPLKAGSSISRATARFLRAPFIEALTSLSSMEIHVPTTSMTPWGIRCNGSWLWGMANG